MQTCIIIQREQLQLVCTYVCPCLQIYDWRQYESKDGENVIPGPSISTRMKAILNRDVTGESGTFELDSSPTNTSVRTVSTNRSYCMCLHTYILL